MGHIGDYHMGRAGATGIQTFRHGLNACIRTVAEHYGCTSVVKTFTKCRADATTCASDKGDRPSKLHSTMLRRTCVSIIMERSMDSLRSKPQGRNPAR